MLPLLQVCLPYDSLWRQDEFCSCLNLHGKWHFEISLSIRCMHSILYTLIPLLATIYKYRFLLLKRELGKLMWMTIADRWNLNGKAKVSGWKSNFPSGWGNLWWLPRAVPLSTKSSSSPFEFILSSWPCPLYGLVRRGDPAPTYSNCFLPRKLPEKKLNREGGKEIWKELRE